MSKDNMEGQQASPQAPNLEQIEGAKTALLTFVMYHYQALRQAGYEINQAKDMVAKEILSLYDKYAEQAEITFRPDTLRNPHQLLDEIMNDVKELGIQGRPVYQKLVDFKRLIAKGE